MSKLSKKLCEVAGIKANILNVITCTVSNDCMKCDYDCNKKVYPDFETNAENFCRLFDLPIEHKTCDTLAELITSIMPIADKKMFLVEVIDYIERNSDKYTKPVIQTLQNEEWSYD